VTNCGNDAFAGETIQAKHIDEDTGPKFWPGFRLMGVNRYFAELFLFFCPHQIKDSNQR
jgi:hypothetical protein